MRNGNRIAAATAVAVTAVALIAGRSDAARAAATSLSFEGVFATTAEPPRLHFRVAYRSADGIHRLEIWRDGASRLKRVTDDTVTTLIGHRPGATDFTMQVIDPRKHTSTRIDRDSLYRIGNFTDWFDLAHGLRHPKGAYRLTARAALTPMPPTPAPCRWYDLTQAGRTTAICWSAANALPLLIASGPGHPVWRVLAINRPRFDAATFRANDRGFIHDDATRDISND